MAIPWLTMVRVYHTCVVCQALSGYFMALVAVGLDIYIVEGG
jgi:hypothetical protein